MTSTTTIEQASTAQLDYFEALWGERSDAEFPREQFASRSKTDVSALIKRALTKPALPVTDEVSDQIVALSQEIGITVVVQPDRARAGRQLRDLMKRVNSKVWNEKLAQADVELDALLAGEAVAVAAAASDEDVPF